MEKILEQISLDDEIKEALMGGRNRFSFWLEILNAYEQADWPRIASLAETRGVEVKEIDKAYTEALKWTNEMLKIS